MLIKITKEEILNTPNDMELGALVRNKMWQEERNERGPQFDDEHFGLILGENGIVTGFVRNEDVLEKCVICGVVTNVLVDTHIDFRDYYVEGCGQLCKKCFKETYDK